MKGAIASEVPRRVLMVCPPMTSAGGMASVAQALMEECNDHGDGWRVRLVNSGGGAGRRGYRHFPVASFRVWRLPYEILHLHVASRGSTLRKAVLASIAARRSIPYVIHLHGAGYEDFLDEMGTLALRRIARFYSNAARVIVLGEAWQDLLIARLGVSPERIRIVHNGAAPAVGKPPVGEVVDPGSNSMVLAMGAVTKRKGTDLLLDALNVVLHESAGQAWSAAIVGPHQEADLVSRARQLSSILGGRIVLPGPKFGDDRAAFYRSAAILCLPSRAEAMPMVLLEAMSAGVPCVTTDVGSVSEIFPDGIQSGGVMLPRVTVEDLTSVLRALMADGPRRSEIGAAGRFRWLEGFTVGAMTTATQGVWAEAFEEGRAAGTS